MKAVLLRANRSVFGTVETPNIPTILIHNDTRRPAGDQYICFRFMTGNGDHLEYQECHHEFIDPNQIK